MLMPLQQLDNSHPVDWMIGTTPLAIFDSGVGGLSFLMPLLQAFPHARFNVLADSQNVPYGRLSPAVLTDLITQVVDQTLASQANDTPLASAALVWGCNTSEALLTQQGHLPCLLPAAPEPCVSFGPIATAMQALRQWIEQRLSSSQSLSHPLRVGILATAATVASQGYPRALAALQAAWNAQHPTTPILIEPIAIAAPPLAGWVESGQWESPECHAALDGWLAAMTPDTLDVLILGCTHYAHILPLIQAKLLSSVWILDPAQGVVDACKAVWGVTPPEAPVALVPQALTRIQFFISGDPAAYFTVASQLYPALFGVTPAVTQPSSVSSPCRPQWQALVLPKASGDGKTFLEAQFPKTVPALP